MVIILLLSLGSCKRIVYLILGFLQHFMGSFAMNENVKATFVVCVFGGERCVERSREKTIPTEMRYAKKIKEKKCALPGLFTNIKRFPLDLGLSQCARLYLCDGVFGMSGVTIWRIYYIRATIIAALSPHGECKHAREENKQRREREI